MTISNGHSRDTDIDMHKKKTLEIGQSGIDNPETLVNVSVSGLSIPDCHISNVFFLCMPMSEPLDCPFLIVTYLTSFSCVRYGTIRNGQSRDTDIGLLKKKTLEI
jgi:hypothetical protein